MTNKRYFTNNDNANLIYFQFPKLLMYGDKYRKMSGDGKLFYMLCLDLIKLSMKKGWKDKNGRYYIKMSLETIKKRMNCQNTKAVNLKKELVEYDLMEIVRVGQGKADRLYVLQLDYSEEDIYRANNDHENVENDEFQNSENQRTLEPQENSVNQNSRTPEIGVQELHKLETIKNKSFKNNLLKEEEEEEILTLNDVTSFLNKQINKRQITNQKTLTAIFEVAHNCKAIGTNDKISMENYCITVIEDKMSKFGQTQKSVNSKKKNQPIRQEILPEWFDENELQKYTATKPSDVDPVTARQKVEELMKRLKESGR